MRNAIPRRSHRERPQPHARTKRGLLEKRKDYVLRSQDYKRKQSTLKRLSEKASERNPDEFYFGMVNERTKDGVAIADRPGSKSLGVKEIKPLKMQDGAYLRTMRSIERRRIEKLREVVSSAPVKNGKILFAENEEEGTVSLGLRLIIATQLRERKMDEIAIGGGKSRDARELHARMERDKELKKMERQVTLQLQLMGKGSVRKIRRNDEDGDDESIPIYKWKPQRQK